MSIANGMNVHPGGKQPKMRDTVMPKGKLQLMVDSDGVPKGLKLVLEECGEGGHGESLITLPGF